MSGKPWCACSVTIHASKAVCRRAVAIPARVRPARSTANDLEYVLSADAPNSAKHSAQLKRRPNWSALSIRRPNA